jgi:hypothetical protein
VCTLRKVRTIRGCLEVADLLDALEVSNAHDVIGVGQRADVGQELRVMNDCAVAERVQEELSVCETCCTGEGKVTQASIVNTHVVVTCEFTDVVPHVMIRAVECASGLSMNVMHFVLIQPERIQINSVLIMGTP